MKTQLFRRRAQPNFFCLLLSLHWWYSIPRLVWCGQLLDPLKKKLKFPKIRNSRNSQNSVWKPNFFLGALKQIFFFAFYSYYTGDTPYRVWFDLDNSLTRWKKIKILKNSQFAKFAKFRMKTQLFPRRAQPNFFFALHSHYTGDTPYRVWFDLDNSLTRWKKIKILKNSQFAKFAKFRMKTQLFPRRTQPKIFLLYTLITQMILHTAFGLIWTTPWPDEKDFFFKFSKFRNSRNSQNSVWKTFFFLGTLYQKFFALHSHYTGDTPYRVWFDLDNSLTRWKKIKILKNSQFAKFAKFRMKTQLFPRRTQPKIFLLYTLITQMILHTAFGLMWTTPWPAEKKNKILKNSQFAKFAKFRMKTQLFPRRAQPNFFCLLLSLHWWYSIPRLVWFGQLLDPPKKN